MITRREVSTVAARYKLKDTQVEKDYVLTWLLLAISRNETLSRILVFKGGTVLKKAYFEDYRFSEDLDFTLLDETVSNEALIREFESVFTFVKRDANISMKMRVGFVLKNSWHMYAGSCGMQGSGQFGV